MNLRKALSCVSSNLVKRSFANRSEEAQFRKEYDAFKELSASLNESKRFELCWEDRYPCLNDRKSTTDFDRHYVYHTAWAARIVAESLPAEHVDIVLHFISAASFPRLFRFGFTTIARQSYG